MGMLMVGRLMRKFGQLVACCWWCLAGWLGWLVGLLVDWDGLLVCWLIGMVCWFAGWLGWLVGWLVWKISWLMRMLGCRWLMRTLQLNLKGPDWRLVYSPHKTPLIAIELKEERPQKNRKDFRELKITNLLVEKPTKPTLCNWKTIKKKHFLCDLRKTFILKAIYMRECECQEVGKYCFLAVQDRSIGDFNDKVNYSWQIEKLK